MGIGLASGGRRGRRGRRGGARRPMSEINVTPLVDVMLVLLIIFMVTAPLLTAGVPIDLPDSRAAALPQEQDKATVAIDSAGLVYIDDAQVSDGDLPGALAALARRGGDGTGPEVTFRADRGVDYGRVMAVMGELNRAGLNRIALVTNAGAASPPDTGRSSDAP